MLKIRSNPVSVIGLLLMLGLTSNCGGGGNDTGQPEPGNSATGPGQQQTAQTVAAAIQNADKAAGDSRLDYGTSLPGSDANGNGVRDDIDRYLLTIQVGDGQRAALTRHARALQAVLSVNASDPAAVASASQALGRTTFCLAEQQDAANLIEPGRRLSEATFNTPERFSAYLRYDDAVSGTSTELPATGNCVQ